MIRLTSVMCSMFVAEKFVALMSGAASLAGGFPGQGALPVAGSFKVLLDGKPAGWEKFHVSRADETVVIKSASELTTYGSSLKLDTYAEIRSGAPIKYLVDATENGKLRRYSVTFSGGGAKVAIEAGGRRSEREVRLSRDVVILDPNVWHQYGQLIAKYNRQRGGRQLFRVFMPRAGLREVPAVVELTGRTDVGSGRDKKKADTFVVELARSSEVRIVADDAGAVLSLDLRELEIKVILE